MLKRLIFHSDRGAQYARKKFNNVIDSYKMITNRSRKGNCCDNEVAERFFNFENGTDLW
jgi:transposase InsO family protein